MKEEKEKSKTEREMRDERERKRETKGRVIKKLLTVKKSRISLTSSCDYNKRMYETK